MRTRLLALGVSSYDSAQTLCALPSSHNDVRAIYQAFNLAADSFFDHEASSVQLDLTADEARAAIQAFAKRSKADDLSVVAFSGHGSLFRDGLALHFADSNGEAIGQLLFAEVYLLLQKFGRGEFLCVLDCCHSGAACNAMKTSTVFFGSKVSLLASGHSTQVSPAHVELSHFSGALQKTVTGLVQSGRDVEMPSLAEEMKTAAGYADVFPQLREGLGSLPIGKRSSGSDAVSDFVDRFYLALSKSNVSERVALWYVLSDNKDVRKLSVLQNAKFKDFREPTWLARRAIGSCAESIGHMKEKKLEVCLKLLRSPDWTDNCVGLIGGRKLVESEEVLREFRRSLTSNGKMDSRWLAGLYLTDASKVEGEDWDRLLQGPLAKTTWGRFELLAFAGAQQERFRHVKATLFSHVERGSIEDIFLDLAEARATWADGVAAGRVETHFDKDPLLNRVVRMKFRDRSARSGSEKWMHSKIFGNWRSNYLHDLPLIIHDSTSAQVGRLFTFIAETPDVALKLALLEGMQSVSDDIVGEFLSRDLFATEPHPWVQREVIKLLASNISLSGVSELARKRMTEVPDIDSNLYPGRIDYLIALGELSFLIGAQKDFFEMVDRHDLSPSDKRSIRNHLTLQRH